MKLFEKAAELTKHLEEIRKNKSIGFVPTMGALHTGHASLIKRAKKENDIVVCSIFVNPIQFTNQDDLKNYPRTLEDDIKKLEAVQCDVLFAPSVEEMYPQSEAKDSGEGFDFGHLENTMEGAFRKGHFKGVAIVVSKLFKMVHPRVAYFGEKDFQQLAVIKELVKKQSFPIKIVGCPTVRENDGLAMSSRNVHLSLQERKEAALISQTLFEAQTKIKSFSMEEVKKWIVETLNASPLMKVEYFEIVDSETLLSIQNLNDAKEVRGCIAVRIGKIRLIDNITLK